MTPRFRFYEACDICFETACCRLLVTQDVWLVQYLKYSDTSVEDQAMIYCSVCGEIGSKIVLIYLALDNKFMFRGQAWLFRPIVNLRVSISCESED